MWRGEDHLLTLSKYVNLALRCLASHHVSRGQAEVDDDGSKGEKVAGTVVFMDPAAELLQCGRSPLELLSQGQQQQQHVGEQKD